MYARFHAVQDSRSGHTVAIRQVFRSSHLCSSRVCWGLFRRVVVSFDDTIQFLLLEK
jgi:hypothetical protein